MTDDARTRGIRVSAILTADDALADYLRAGQAVQTVHAVDAVRIAVDALLAAGWRPPVSDDTRMSVVDVVDNAIYDLIEDEDSTIGRRIAEALAAAGLLAEPSHLARLAAWAEANGTVKIGGGYLRAWESYPGEADLQEECLPDVQEAARRVLARLEATDG